MENVTAPEAGRRQHAHSWHGLCEPLDDRAQALRHAGGGSLMQ
jgi:hypothetical protein